VVLCRHPEQAGDGVLDKRVESERVTTIAHGTAGR
jgi:hypothetical protein